MKNALSLAVLTVIFFSPLTQAASISADQGTLRVTVLDAQGNVVPDAPVYIYGESRSHFVGGADIPGSSTFTMKEGTYRISSAYIKRGADYIDRFASNEAHVSVVAGDNVSVVLTLNPLEAPADQKPVSYAQLHVAGIPGSLLSNN